MARITIKAIAEQAGLARSTVSEILSGKNNYCSQENRNRVKEIANKLGYVPNVGFKIMTGRKTNTTALLFSQERTYHDEYNLRLAMSLLNRLQQHGHSAYTVTMSRDAKENLRQIRELISRGCHEFIFLGAPVGVKELYDELKSENLDWVSFNGYYREGDGVNFCIDYESIYRAFIRNFKERELEVVCVMSEVYLSHFCQKTFRTEELDRSRNLLVIPSVMDVEADSAALSFHNVQNAVRNSLGRFPGKRGWICASDHEALGALAALRDTGRPVGDENGSLVCGTGNTRLSQFSPLPVSSADLQLNKAADILMENLHSKVSREHILTHRIIFR